MKCNIEGFFDDLDSIVVYDSQGNNISDSPVLRYDDYDDAYDDSVEISEEGQKLNLPDISVRDALNMSGWTPRTPEDDFVDWYNFDFCFAESPEESSLYSSVPYLTFENFASPGSEGGCYYVNDSRGYAGIVECLADIPLSEGDQRLHLNAKVNKIKRSDSDDECVCATAVENIVWRKHTVLLMLY